MIVADASVIIAALLPEKDSETARAVVAGEDCIAPDLIVSECVNALWKSVRLGRILPAEAELARQALKGLGIRLEPSEALAARALELAIALAHPAYDCFYLALAEARRVPMVTQDGNLLRKIRGDVTTATVRLLGEPLT
jgi:predicted nucleic acid-binding protein